MSNPITPPNSRRCLVNRLPATWKAGIIVIGVAALMAGSYAGQQALVDQQAPAPTPTVVGSAPEWSKQPAPCGTPPLLNCPTEKEVTR